MASLIAVVDEKGFLGQAKKNGYEVAGNIVKGTFKVTVNEAGDGFEKVDVFAKEVNTAVGKDNGIIIPTPVNENAAEEADALTANTNTAADGKGSGKDNKEEGAAGPQQGSDAPVAAKEEIPIEIQSDINRNSIDLEAEEKAKEAEKNAKEAEKNAKEAEKNAKNDIASSMAKRVNQDITKYSILDTTAKMVNDETTAKNAKVDADKEKDKQIIYESTGINVDAIDKANAEKAEKAKKAKRDAQVLYEGIGPPNGGKTKKHRRRRKYRGSAKRRKSGKRV